MNTELPKVGLSSMFAQRQTNMMTNLQHRIDAAAASRDRGLLELLTIERTQLESHWHDAPPPTHRWPKLIHLLQRIEKELTFRSQLSVERRITAKGEEWWHIEDPRSGKTFNAESLNVAMHWIEQNQLGH